MSAPDVNLEEQSRRHTAPLLGISAVVAVVLVYLMISVAGLVRQAQPIRSSGPKINDQTGKLIHFSTPVTPAPQPTLPQGARDRGYGQQGYGETPAQTASALDNGPAAPVRA